MLIRYPRRVTVNDKRLISKHKKSEKKITRGNEATRTPTPTGSAPKTMSPPPFGWADISICHVHMNVFAKCDEIL